jgi:two-component system, sensor histidine kinase and response regulator
MASNYFLENLLQWSKSHLAGLVPQPVTFSISTLVNECILLLGPAAQEKGIKIIYETTSFVVRADVEMTRFVLRNLISNAIKFSFEYSSIKLTSTCKADTVMLSVHDSGNGIPANQIDQLFTLDTVINAGTRNERGTGLGLMLCREFMQANNGKIEVVSTEGVGTTFTITLPLASITLH